MATEPSTEYKELTTCQSCGANDPNLLRIDSGLKLALADVGKTDVPQQVCANCFRELKKGASQGAHLKAKEEAKTNMRTELWKARFELVKQGRRFLQRGELAESAVSYEKYLKIVCIVSEKERHQLDPKLFNESPKEITIIASVLWDLMLIYDSHIKFAVKHREVSEVLAKFLRFSPIYNSVIRKAEIEISKAKNPQVFRNFLKLCDVQSTRCFIANAAFESPLHPTVVLLCRFRDQILTQFFGGRLFIAFYYRVSPKIAATMDRFPLSKKPARSLLRGVAFLINKIFNLP